MGAAAGANGQCSVRTARRVPAGLGAFWCIAQWCRPARRQQAGSVDSLAWLPAGGGEGQAEDGQEDEAEEFPHASGMSVSVGGWCVCKVSG